MNTMTNDGINGSGAAIVSDSESDDDDNATETSVKKTVSFDDAKTMHPKGILKTGGNSQTRSTSSARDPIPVKKEDIDMNVAYDQWGHHGIRRLQEMARVNGFRLTGDLKPCDACGISKASQTRVSKTTKVKATTPGERMFMDTTGPFSDGPLKN